MSQKHSFTRSNLAKTQELIMNFIQKYLSENGYPPSVRDICEGTGIKSTSTVHSHLKRLTESGLLTYESGRRRALSIVQDDLDNVEETNEVETNNNVNSLPLVGTVAAGTPLLAVENIEETLAFPESLIRAKGDQFVLRVRGDSMEEAAILDGDYVIIQKQNQCRQGDIVVALIDDEATVKTFKLVNGKPFLKPENPKYNLIPYDERNSMILGKVIGVFRNNILIFN